jgi:hypothetical protein
VLARLVATLLGDMLGQLINALAEFLGLLTLDLPAARHGGNRSTQVGQRPLNTCPGVLIVSDAEVLGAGARLGSADRVGEADDGELAESRFGDEADSVAGRSPVMLAIAKSTTAIRASAVTPPAIHQLRRGGGLSGRGAAGRFGAGMVVAGIGSGCVA